MTSTSPKKDTPSETSVGAGQVTKQQQQKRAIIPQIEVVNEIQIVVNKKDNRRSLNVTTPSDSKDVKKCISIRSSKTDLTAATTPTTVATLDTTTKNVSSKNSRRSSRNEKEKSESSSTICVCGKLLKRMKGFLEKKEKPGGGEFYLMFICC